MQQKKELIYIYIYIKLHSSNCTLWQLFEIGEWRIMLCSLKGISATREISGLQGGCGLVVFSQTFCIGKPGMLLASPPEHNLAIYITHSNISQASCLNCNLLWHNDLSGGDIWTGIDDFKTTQHTTEGEKLLNDKVTLVLQKLRLSICAKWDHINSMKKLSESLFFTSADVQLCSVTLWYFIQDYRWITLSTHWRIRQII